MAFVSAYNLLVTEKKEIIASAEIIRRTLCVTDDLQEGSASWKKERYDGLVQRYDVVTAAISAEEA